MIYLKKTDIFYIKILLKETYLDDNRCFFKCLFKNVVVRKNKLKKKPSVSIACCS